MKMQFLTLALLLGTATPAIAGQTPTAGRADSRMRTVIYDSSQVVRLSTAVGSALVISFSPDENVTAVAVSNSKDLVANPRDNFLFMKAKAALSPQPIIVLTSGPKGARRYVFEVEAVSASDSKQPTYYSVEFLYPGDRRAERLTSQKQRDARIEVNRAHDLMENSIQLTLPGELNWHYIGRGNRKLTPVEIFDNGQSTAFRFPGNMRIPAIFKINPDGREATVNYSIKGDYVVVGGVAQGWRLRDGDIVLCIWNRAYDMIGRTTGTSTISKKVKRITKDAPK